MQGVASLPLPRRKSKGNIVDELVLVEPQGLLLSDKTQFCV